MTDAAAGAGWDVHTHLLPTTLVEAAQSGHFGMGLTDDAVVVPGFWVARAQMGNPQLLLDRLNSDHLHGAVVGVPPPFFRADLPSSERAAYSTLINDGLRDTVRAAPDRLRPLAYLPTDNPAAAVAVADALDASWAGVIVGTQLHGASYADPAYGDLWALLEERGLPLLMHPSESEDERLKPFYLSNLLGNPMETTLAAATLIFADIPARFPRLKVILSHGGGAMATLAARWQRGYDTDRPGVPKLSLSPAEAIGWFFVDTIVHSTAQLRFLAEQLGQDRLLQGSDWPFPMGTPSADSHVAGLGEDFVRAVRLDNVAAAFGERLTPTRS